MELNQENFDLLVNEVEGLSKKNTELEKLCNEQAKQIEEHGEKLKEQEKLNKQIGTALKKVATAAAEKTEAPAAPKKKEPVVTPTKAVEVDGEKYLFTGPKAKDKNGEVVLTATIVESPDEYKTELAEWVANGSGILKKQIS